MIRNILWLPSNQPLKFNYRKYINYYKNCVYFCDILYWVPYHRIFTILLYHFANLTTKYPGEKIVLLAKLYHLLTIYFGVGDYCLSNSLTSNLFSSQSSSLYWLRSAKTDKPDKTPPPNR